MSRVTNSGLPADPSCEHAGAPQPIDPRTGQHKDYWVLSADERAKGFVRPVRHSYRHVGLTGPSYPLRALTQDEQLRYQGCGYVQYEEYLENHERGSVIGRFWTQAQLDKVGKGCRTVTTMSRAIAETYARNPHFYGRTFCCDCGIHLPVGADGEFIWEDGSRVGT